MGKIGSYEYPELSVSEAIRVAEVLVKDFQGKAADLDNFAKAIGHKTYNSGSFYYKLADMRKYGLMDKREVEATPLAEVVATPKDNAEKQEAINKMVSNISLFEKLKERLKTKNPALEQFRTQLIEVSQDRTKASSEAEKIRKIYIEAMSFTNQNIEQTKDEDDKKDKSEHKKTTSENMISASSGEVYIEMPKDKRYLKVVENLLSNLKLQLELEEDKPKEK